MIITTKQTNLDTLVYDVFGAQAWYSSEVMEAEAGSGYVEWIAVYTDEPELEDVQIGTIYLSNDMDTLAYEKFTTL